MRRSHERFSRRRREELSRFPKLVDSIIVTNVALRNRLPQNSTSMFQWIAHLSYLIGTLFRSRESLEQERDESPDSSIVDGRKSSDQGRKRKQQSILSCSVGALTGFGERQVNCQMRPDPACPVTMPCAISFCFRHLITADKRNKQGAQWRGLARPGIEGRGMSQSGSYVELPEAECRNQD